MNTYEYTKILFDPLKKRYEIYAKESPFVLRYMASATTEERAETYAKMHDEYVFSLDDKEQ